MTVSDAYMGRTRVLDKDQFKAFWDAMKAEGGIWRSTTVGDPPTGTISLEDKVVAQYFAAFGHDPETYYVDPDRWRAYLESGDG